MVGQHTRIRSWLNRLLAVVIFGSGKDILKPKKNGRSIWIFLDWLDFFFFSFADRLDSKVFFRGRNVKTASGRVRSRGERKIVAFFQRHEVQFRYEPSLVLGKKELHPDFFLPEHNVYVEFWGMAYDNPRYRAIMKLKKGLYQKHHIPVVSLFPRHLRNLEKYFPNLLEKITGRTITLGNNKGGE